MKKNNQQRSSLKPFLKWAGGKTSLLEEIKPFIPSINEVRCYWEPFLGSAAMYFSLMPPKAVLSDLNQNLINCYISVREKPELLSHYLSQHFKFHGNEYYYKVRDIYNKSSNSVAQSARFIYLNRTCFNGLYRENKSGDFNVPFGKRKTPPFPDFNQLKKISGLLQNVDLLTCNFEDLLDKVKAGDFVYFDPPYTVMHKSNGFIKYNAKLFSWKDQEKLKEAVDVLTDRNVKVLISNAAHQSIEDLYSNYKIFEIFRSSCISANKSYRSKISEYLIRNY